jgi:cytochrome c oxidase cbb3-type subunit 3
LAIFAVVLTTIELVVLVPLMSRLKTEKPLGPVYAAAGDQAGRAVYQDNCGACHGPDGRGNPAMGAAMKGLDLAAAAGKSAGAIARTIRKGKGAMPAFTGLSDAEVQQLATYVRSVRGKK